MGERKQTSFDYPLKGVNENFAYRQQPEGTTPDALNVRAYDPISKRQRGGQRNGLSKYITAAVNGSQPIQAISQLTTAYDPTIVVQGLLIGSDSIQYPAGWMGLSTSGAANWDVWQTAANVSGIQATPFYRGTHTITAVNQGAHQFTITTTSGTAAGLAATFPNGSIFTVTGSTGNNNTSPGYTVSSTSTTATTVVITITGSGTYPPSTVADGVITNGFSPVVASSGGHGVAGMSAAANVGGCALSQPGGVVSNLPSAFILKSTFRLSSTAGTFPEVGFLFRVAATLVDGWGAASVTHYQHGTATVFFAAAKVQAQIRCGDETPDTTDLTAIITAYGGSAAWLAAEHTLQLTGSGNFFRLYLDGALVVSHSSPVNSANTRWGFGVVCTTVNPTATYMRALQAFAGVVPTTLRTTKLITASGGNLYQGDSSGVTLIPGGSSAMNTTGIVRMQQAFGKMYFVDGTSSHYKVYDPSTGSVIAWVPTTGSLPAGIFSGTAYPVTAASITSSTLTVTGNLTGLVAIGDIVTVSGGTESPSNNGYYRITNTSFGASTTLTVSPAPLNNTPAGVPILGPSQSAATMIALYRGRIVLAGVASDPQNWFMSKAGDPLDWNYTPTTITQTMAVAGNNSTAGLMGDVITCIAPYNDDLMFMGGDHTLWVMRGDPAAGGVIDNISYQTGIVGPDAWTRDPEGTFYFFGAGTLWRVSAGTTTPEPLSRGVLDRTFGAIDYATYQVRLLWDENNKGVHLYFTPATQPGSSPSHYFWDRRAGGFWPDQYPVALGPTAVWNFDADLPNDRAMLLGGFDSYIRQIPATIQKDDDGTVIHSYVRYAPKVYGGDTANARLSDLVPIMDTSSDQVSLRIFAGDSPESVAVSTVPQVSKVLRSGRNVNLRQRVTGNALLLELESVASTWVTATYYAAGVQVMHGTDLHTCLVPHTSGTFATDLASLYWTAVGVATTRSWAVESITGTVDISGKVRNKRL
jgi:hypothetical protein